MQDAHCEALVRAADKDRFLAALFAPAEHRGALYALYAFNVEIVRVRESIHEPLAGEIRLQWGNDAIAGKAAGDVEANPVAAALLAAGARYRVARELLSGLSASRRSRPRDRGPAPGLSHSCGARRALPAARCFGAAWRGAAGCRGQACDA